MLATTRAVTHLHSAARCLAFWLGYLVLCWAGEQLTLAPEYGVALWPTSGLFMAVLARSARREWSYFVALGISADILASITLFDFPLKLALPIAAGNAMEAMVGAALLKRWSPSESKLQDTREALSFALFAGCLAPFASMVMGGTAVALHTSTPLLESWRLWWTGDAVGIMTVAPLMLTARLPDWTQLRMPSWMACFDAAALLTATLTLGYLCLGHSQPVTFLTLPLVIWAAIRFGVIGSALVCALLVLQAVLYARAGTGPFATHLSLPASQSALQAFGLVTALTGLLLAVTVKQAWHLKRRAEKEVAVRTTELHQREQELESALTELRQVDIRKDQFVAALAHEVLNPIAALSNGLFLLDKDLPGAQRVSVRAMMKRQLDLLTLLARDLLELARIKSGKVHLQRQLNDLSALVIGAAAAVQDRMDQKSQRLQIELPVGKAVVFCDEKRIMQVITNLLANAHRHCPHGTNVHLKAFADRGGATFTVQDNGPGIPREQLVNIFKRYEQLDGGITEGLGVGLALAKQLVDLHEGRLEVKSDVGIGTTFVVRLPAQGVRA